MTHQLRDKPQETIKYFRAAIGALERAVARGDRKGVAHFFYNQLAKWNNPNLHKLLWDYKRDNPAEWAKAEGFRQQYDQMIAEQRIVPRLVPKSGMAPASPKSLLQKHAGFVSQLRAHLAWVNSEHANDRGARISSILGFLGRPQNSGAKADLQKLISAGAFTPAEEKQLRIVLSGNDPEVAAQVAAREQTKKQMDSAREEADYRRSLRGRTVTVVRSVPSAAGEAWKSGEIKSSVLGGKGNPFREAGGAVGETVGRAVAGEKGATRGRRVGEIGGSVLYGAAVTAPVVVGGIGAAPALLARGSIGAAGALLAQQGPRVKDLLGRVGQGVSANAVRGYQMARETVPVVLRYGQRGVSAAGRLGKGTLRAADDFKIGFFDPVPKEAWKLATDGSTATRVIQAGRTVVQSKWWATRWWGPKVVTVRFGSYPALAGRAYATYMAADVLLTEMPGHLRAALFPRKGETEQSPWWMLAGDAMWLMPYGHLAVPARYRKPLIAAAAVVAARASVISGIRKQEAEYRADPLKGAIATCSRMTPAKRISALVTRDFGPDHAVPNYDDGHVGKYLTTPEYAAEIIRDLRSALSDDQVLADFSSKALLEMLDSYGPFANVDDVNKHSKNPSAEEKKEIIRELISIIEPALHDIYSQLDHPKKVELEQRLAEAMQ